MVDINGLELSLDIVAGRPEGWPDNPGRLVATTLVVRLMTTVDAGLWWEMAVLVLPEMIVEWLVLAMPTV